VLVKQLRNMDTRAQIAVLGALRNLSFGRTNEANKLEIAGEHGLTEILLALKKSRVSEVRELLTSVLWNLSSSQVHWFIVLSIKLHVYKKIGRNYCTCADIA
jgi:hypothetical protein